MARREEVKRGGIHTVYSWNVDYASYRANLPYGVIGIKVWIYKEILWKTNKIKDKAYVISKKLNTENGKQDEKS